MRVDASADRPAPPRLVAAVAATGQALDPALGDDALAQLNRLRDLSRLRTSLGSVTVVPAGNGGGAVAGVGEPDGFDAETLRTAAAAVAARIAEFHASLAWVLDASLPLPLAEQARAVVDGVALGAYDPGAWRSARSRREIPSLTIVTADPAAAEATRRAGIVARFLTL